MRLRDGTGTGASGCCVSAAQVLRSAEASASASAAQVARTLCVVLARIFTKMSCGYPHQRMKISADIERISTELQGFKYSVCSPVNLRILQRPSG